jgi:hemerythrin-like domain-containing protein
MSDDAIVMLRAEHRELRRALRTFTRTRDTETARRGEIAGDLGALVSAHVRAETDVLYPRIRELVPALDPLLRVPEERHRVIEEVERRLDGLEPYDARLAAAVRVLDELVTAHIDQDEDEVYPRIRAEVGRNDLQRIGREIRSVRDDRSTSDGDRGLTGALHGLLR